MQIEIFTLCDSAHVYAGKAVISGSFNQIIAKKLPIRRDMTLAVRIAFDKEESGDKTFIFCIKNPDGSLLVPELKCETKQNLPVEKQTALTTYDLNVVLSNVVLGQVGIYSVTMKYADKEYVLKFFVQEE